MYGTLFSLYLYTFISFVSCKNKRRKKEKDEESGMGEEAGESSDGVEV